MTPAYKHIFSCILLLHAFFIACSTPVAGPLKITEGGKSVYQIVIPAKATADEKKAASVLQKYIEQISGASLPIVADSKPTKQFEISIGRTNRLSRTGITAGKLKQDGFSIKTADNRLFLLGEKIKGNTYAAYTLLDTYLGCKKIGPIPPVIVKNANITLEPINITQQPAFNYREIWFYKVRLPDEEYLDWHKLNTQYDPAMGWGLFMHTFDILVPAKEYFKDHPEYYALRNGKRQPSQLCLSNKEVLEVLVKNLQKSIQERPSAKYWSVSQNDNYEYCNCRLCASTNAREKSQQGTILSFVNKVAARFPDRIISTLAFQYSQTPPLMVKPAKNVNIMLCAISCNRNVPISRDPASAGFRRDFERWQTLTKNILIWDYVTQFAHFLAPFPNFDVLQPNLEYFNSKGIQAVFEQGAGGFPEDFSDLKTYLLAKLLWNPRAEKNQIINEFLPLMYGKASGKVAEYIDLRQKAVAGVPSFLQTGASPREGIATYLSPGNIDKYKALLNSAADAVRSEPVYLRRIKFLQLCVEYSELEILKKNLAKRSLPTSSAGSDVETFRKHARELGVRLINESLLTVDDYQ